MKRSKAKSIRSAVSWIVVALAFAGCTHPNSKQNGNATVNSHTGFSDSETVSPVEIVLNDQGTARIINRSSTTVMIVHSIDLQPSELEILDESGEESIPFDNRSMRKIDNTVYEDNFHALGPGQSLELFSMETARSGTERTITWGPFEYDDLKPAEYRVRVFWHGETDSFLDNEGNSREMPNAVLGEFESNQIRIDLR